jgi:hypothetical protein
MHTENMPAVVVWMMIGMGIYFAVIIAVLMIHGIWLAPFIERHGRRSAGFFVFGILPGLGLIQDYLAARQICRERGIKLRWMTWFGSLLVVAGVLMVLVIGYILFSFLHT